MPILNEIHLDPPFEPVWDRYALKLAQEADDFCLSIKQKLNEHEDKEDYYYFI